MQSRVVKLTAAKVVWETRVLRGDTPIAVLQIGMAGIRDSKRQLVVLPSAVLAVLQPF